MAERRTESPPPVNNPVALGKLPKEIQRRRLLTGYLKLLAQQTERGITDALAEDLEATKKFLQPPTVLCADSLIRSLTQERNPNNYQDNPVRSAETDFGLLNLNTNSGVAFSPLTGTAVRLKPYSVFILAQLMSAPERVFSLRDLYTLRWGQRPSNPVVELMTIRTHVSRLRRDLGETDERRIIHTLLRYGYSLRRLPRFNQIIEAAPHAYDSQVIVIDAVLGKAVFYPDRGEILYQGREITLTPIEARIMQGLAEHPGWILKPEAIDSNSLLMRSIVSHLRRKLGPELGKLVKTKIGFGYYLEKTANS